MLHFKFTSSLLIVYSCCSIIPTATTDQCCDGTNCCDKGWLGYNGFCYRYIAYKKSWFDARTYCANLGADLVSIHSTLENDIVTVLTRGAEVSINLFIYHLPSYGLLMESSLFLPEGGGGSYQENTS